MTPESFSLIECEREYVKIGVIKKGLPSFRKGWLIGKELVNSMETTQIAELWYALAICTNELKNLEGEKLRVFCF